MKKLLLLLFLIVTLFGCGCKDGKTTIGDGKVDMVEASTIRVAVGLAFAAKPNTVVPAYAISTALLQMTESDTEKVSPIFIEQALNSEIGKLNLDPLTVQSVNDLIVLIRAQIIDQIGVNNDVQAKVIVIRQVIQIVHDSAGARLGVTQIK